jgi:hypothetical protein
MPRFTGRLKKKQARQSRHALEQTIMDNDSRNFGGALGFIVENPANIRSVLSPSGEEK